LELPTADPVSRARSWVTARFPAFNQGGVVTRSQALEYGMTAAQVRKMVDAGRWRRLARGVYATQVPVWEQLAWAGLLQAGEGACLGRAAAGYLYGINGPPSQIDIWIPPGRSVPRRADTPVPKVGGPTARRSDDRDVARAEQEMWNPWRFHQGARTVVGTPPRSGVEETVLDLCEEKLHQVFRDEEPEIWFLRTCPATARGWIRTVIRPVLESGLTTYDDLRAALDARPLMEGGSVIRREIREMEEGRPIAGRSTSVRRREPPGGTHPITD
jgi:hypothetical protein